MSRQEAPGADHHQADHGDEQQARYHGYYSKQDVRQESFFFFSASNDGRHCLGTVTKKNGGKQQEDIKRLSL